VDVFTATPLTGNQLAVVHDADDLDEATMLAFARETRLSETTFVQAPAADGADYRNRIWMTRGELPFAGHPSLGTAVAVAAARGVAEASYVQQTPAGLQRVDVDLSGDVARATMLQEPPAFGPELDPAHVLAAAGLGAADADPALPPQVVSTGARQVLAPVRAGALDELRPDFRGLEALLGEHGAVTLYLAVCEPGGGTVRARSLYVDPDSVSEDPATGSAAGPLCAYLHQRTGREAVTIEQGVEMGRPSRLDCAVEAGTVRVGGDAVVLATGTVRL
jgi:trans-2,3-dihydro-3-hydroxyanthranilate isomerase